MSKKTGVKRNRIIFDIEDSPLSSLRQDKPIFDKTMVKKFIEKR